MADSAGFMDPMTETFRRVQSLVLDMPEVDAFLTELAGAAAAVVAPSASCGINVYRDGQLVTAVSSDARAAVLDETQYELDEGPCLQALRTGVAVHVSDSATEDRWPPYLELARRHGLTSSLSLPLVVDSQTVGVLNLFVFDEPDPFEQTRYELGLRYAAEAAGALQLLSRLTGDHLVRQQLEQALSSRSIIDRAIGILIERQHCTGDQAFILLRRVSQHTNRKLRDVAVDLIETTSGEQHSPHPFMSGAAPRAL